MSFLDTLIKENSYLKPVLFVCIQTSVWFKVLFHKLSLHTFRAN